MGKERKIADDLKRGFTVSKEIMDMQDLPWMERCLLSLYAFYTKGAYKGCTYTNKEIADFYGVSEHTIQIWKSDLARLGYIEVKNQWTTSKIASRGTKN